MNEQTKELDAIGEGVERAKTASQQPRFKQDTESVFGRIIRWVKDANLEAPDYSSNSLKRDQWLREFWLREPHWAFAVNQAIMIDANRRWTLTGGRNQVYRYLTIFHEVEDGKGWRHYIKKNARSYRVTDMGAVTEVGRDGRRGPMRGLYTVDSARCKLTGQVKEPLAYYPARARMQKWRPNDFFRVVPTPSDDEKFHDLGYCATSFALELVKLLYALVMHDQEKVGAKMPEGFILFDGIGETQWNRLLEARDAKLDAKDRKYFGGLMVMFNEGLEQANMQLLSLSTLPPSFDRRTFLDQTLYAYAGILGLDPSEIWPVQFGSMGRGTEMEMQHRKAATKGAYDFPLAHQEAIQRHLPDTLQFEYEQRDAEGELMDAEVAKAWTDVAARLYEAGAAQGMPLLEREYSLSLLAEHGVIPPDWTEIEEETKADDTERGVRRLRDRAMTNPYVQRAIVQFPKEPIVRYCWPSDRMVTLWERAEIALSQRVWSGFKRRQADDDDILYEGDDFTITMEDVDKAIAAGYRRVGTDLGALLEAGEVEQPLEGERMCRVRRETPEGDGESEGDGDVTDAPEPEPEKVSLPREIVNRLLDLLAVQREKPESLEQPPKQQEIHVHLPEMRLGDTVIHVPENPTEVTVNVPEQPAPQVTVGAPKVNVEAPTIERQEPPNVTVEAPVINVNVPEQEAPQVTVEAPVITVNIPEQEPPQVTVEGATVNVEAPEVKVPEVPITLEIVQPDEIVETETVVERDSRTQRITKTQKTSQRVRNVD